MQKCKPILLKHLEKHHLLIQVLVEELRLFELRKVHRELPNLRLAQWLLHHAHVYSLRRLTGQALLQRLIGGANLELPKN